MQQQEKAAKAGLAMTPIKSSRGHSACARGNLLKPGQLAFTKKKGRKIIQRDLPSSCQEIPDPSPEKRPSQAKDQTGYQRSGEFPERLLAE